MDDMPEGYPKELLRRKSYAKNARMAARSAAAVDAMRANAKTNRIQRAEKGLKNAHSFKSPEQEIEDAKRDDWARYNEHLQVAARHKQANTEQHDPGTALAAERDIGDGMKNNTNNTSLDEAGRLAQATIAEQDKKNAVAEEQRKLNAELTAQQANVTQLAQSELLARIEKCKCKAAPT